jgi:hypothetical protein
MWQKYDKKETLHKVGSLTIWLQGGQPRSRSFLGC